MQLKPSIKSFINQMKIDIIKLSVFLINPYAWFCLWEELSSKNKDILVTSSNNALMTNQKGKIKDVWSIKK